MVQGMMELENDGQGAHLQQVADPKGWGGEGDGAGLTSFILQTHPSGNALHPWERSKRWDEKNREKSSLLTIHFISSCVKLILV